MAASNCDSCYFVWVMSYSLASSWKAGVLYGYYYTACCYYRKMCRQETQCTILELLYLWLLECELTCECLSNIHSPFSLVLVSTTSWRKYLSLLAAKYTTIFTMEVDGWMKWQFKKNNNKRIEPVAGLRLGD